MRVRLRGYGSCPSICTTPIASICSSCSCRRRQSNCNRSMETASATISSGAPALMVRAIRELQEAGVEPDIWKIEGLDRREDCVQVVKTARRDGRDDVGCIVLGRGEDEAHVHTWLTTAAGVPGFIGFAVGRRLFGTSDRLA